VPPCCRHIFSLIWKGTSSKIICSFSVGN
jgi:hypothetical protein